MPFKNRETLLAYIADNKERRAENFKRWESENRERRKAYKRELRKKQPKMSAEERAKANAYNAKWREANREKYRAYQAAWREKNPKCKQREMERLREREYGLSPEQFEAMVVAQGGKCAICEDQPKGSFHVDHCHATGDVRGLLCGKCNRGLGMYGDSPALLRKAALYVERHQANRHTA